MGFTVYYRSTCPVTEAKAKQIQQAVSIANQGRSWLSCEPIDFFPDQRDGHLFGGSKPTFEPAPVDVASAEQEGLPNGGIDDLLEILCMISRDHGVDWEFSHDYDPGPIGFIRGGIADDRLMVLIETLAETCDMVGDFAGDFRQDSGKDHSPRDARVSTDGPDDDDEPRILRLWPKPD